MAKPKICLLYTSLGQGVSGDGAEALRQGTFQVVSILTSTGFQTIPSFADLGPALLFLFGLLMLVGAEARSTSGGIKLYRVAVASLGLGHDLHERYGNKRHVTSIKINRFGKRSVLTEVDVAEAQTYVVLYLLLCAAGAFALILCGATLQEAVFDFISCLGSTGVGTGFLGAESGPAPLLIGSAGMLLGRLEIIDVYKRQDRPLDTPLWPQRSSPLLTFYLLVSRFPLSSRASSGRRPWPFTPHSRPTPDATSPPTFGNPRIMGRPSSRKARLYQINAEIAALIPTACPCLGRPGWCAGRLTAARRGRTSTSTPRRDGRPPPGPRP